MTTILTSLDPYHRNWTGVYLISAQGSSHRWWNLAKLSVFFPLIYGLYIFMIFYDGFVVVKSPTSPRERERVEGAVKVGNGGCGSVACYLLRQRREIDCVVWCFLLPHPHHSQQGNGELFGPINFQVAVVWNGFRTIIPAGKGLDAWTCCGGRDKPILVRYHQPSNLPWVRFSLVGEGSIMVGHKWRIIRFQFPVAFIL